MSDLTTIIARIDALQASVQAMANALAAKADKTNLVLDKNNPTGLQAATQTMANAIAQRLDDFYPRLDEAAYEVHATNCRTRAIMYATCEPDAHGIWPCSFDHPGGPDDEPVGGAGKKPEPKSAV